MSTAARVYVQPWSGPARKVGEVVFGTDDLARLTERLFSESTCDRCGGTCCSFRPVGNTVSRTVTISLCEACSERLKDFE